MTDHQLQSTIDAALDELAETRPGPHFVPRLRAHVAHSQRTTLCGRGTSLALAAVVVLASALVIGTVGRLDVTPATRVAQDIALAPIPVAIDRADTSARAARAVRPASSARSLRARVLEAPEVMVPSDQLEAVGRLFAALNAGQPETVSMMRSVNTSNAGEAALTVAPIRIDPVIVSPVFDK